MFYSLWNICFVNQVYLTKLDKQMKRSYFKHMQKELNISIISQKAKELGLNQARISKDLEVSREAVSQWLKGVVFPRPAKLLKLGHLLGLTYSELVNNENEVEPVIAFRKVRGAKTKDNHVQRAKEMGFALEKLVDFLPFETITKPPELNKPHNEYNYIQNAVKAVRERLGIKKITVEVDEIIKCFSIFKTILIPVLLGDKKNHENALHIHLPASTTNWVYINLDTKIFDFKFWLVHEIGHIFTPSLKGEEAEDFVDNFAGAFLFPIEIARTTYSDLTNQRTNRSRYSILFKLAQKYLISPYTILYEVNKYATKNNYKEIDITTEFHAVNNKFINNYHSVSQTLFGNDKPEAKKYIKVVEKEFESVFFELLKKYIIEEKSSPSYIKSVLNVSTIDSIAIFQSLLDGIHQNTS